MDENFHEAPEAPKPWISSRTYDALKWVAQILLPALGTFYAAVAGVVGLPYALEVTGVILAVDTLLGTLLGLSKRQYENSGAAFDGNVTLVPDEEAEFTDVNFSVDPVALSSGQKELRLKVRRA